MATFACLFYGACFKLIINTRAPLVWLVDLNAPKGVDVDGYLASWLELAKTLERVWYILGGCSNWTAFDMKAFWIRISCKCVRYCKFQYKPSIISNHHLQAASPSSPCEVFFIWWLFGSKDCAHGYQNWSETWTSQKCLGYQICFSRVRMVDKNGGVWMGPLMEMVNGWGILGKSHNY